MLSDFLCSRATFLTAMLGAGFSFACLSPSAAVPIISAVTHTVKVQLDGIDMTAPALSLSVVRLGTLKEVSEARPMAPRDGCSAGGRLTLTGTRIICRDTRGQLQAWYKSVLEGKTDRKSGSVIFLDRAGQEVLRTINLFECFPTAYNRADPDDCDDKADDALVAVDLHVSAVEIVSSKTTPKHKGDYLPAHNFKLELDRCMPGSPCPGTSTDEVDGIAFEMSAAGFLPGPPAGHLEGISKLTVTIRDCDDDDALSAWILESQGKPSPTPTIKATVNTSRSNIKHQQKHVTPSTGPTNGGTVLRLINARILSVELPTIDFTGNPPASDSHTIQKVEIAVEKVERA